MAHAAAARQLRDEYEAATGIRPKYPQSWVTLHRVRRTLDRYTAAMAAFKASNAQRQAAFEASNTQRQADFDARDAQRQAALDALDAQRQGAKGLADEFSRLGLIGAFDGDFNLDTPTRAGQLGGEAGQLLQ